ncbi:metallopeptidase family protein [Hyphococcus sp.]|uniref:metallopeptidase family protein n=1 Tax=Hyphococcus sp. TaxID=2038636 RepID=UPI003D1187B6
MTEPDLESFDRLVRDAYAGLPAAFRALCGNVVIHVADEAEREILDEMGIDDPLDLSGLFEGVEFAAAEDALPNHVHLYRRSIIAEWREDGEITLEDLVTHVLVHEIGHHFGLSDEDMHAIEEAAE